MKHGLAISLGLLLLGVALLLPEAEAQPPDDPPTCEADDAEANLARSADG